MTGRMNLGAVLVFWLALVQSAPATAHVLDEVWERASYQEHGFSMLMPPDPYTSTSPYLAASATEFDDGRLTLHGNMEGTAFLGVLSPGVELAPPELNRFRADLTDEPAMVWESISDGEHTAGWKWFQTFRATRHGETYFGGYGVGDNGSYLFLVKTSDSDFAIHRRDYRAWFDSIRLEE